MTGRSSLCFSFCFSGETTKPATYDLKAWDHWESGGCRRSEEAWMETLGAWRWVLGPYSGICICEYLGPYSTKCHLRIEMGERVFPLCFRWILEQESTAFEDMAKWKPSPCPSLLTYLRTFLVASTTFPQGWAGKTLSADEMPARSLSVHEFYWPRRQLVRRRSKRSYRFIGFLSLEVYCCDASVWRYSSGCFSWMFLWYEECVWWRRDSKGFCQAGG